MTITWHRRLIWIESILITMPMFVLVCWFGALGIAFGLTLAETTSVIVGIGFMTVAITGIVGMVAFAHLSFLYLSRGLVVLQQSSRRFWVLAAFGAALAVLAMLLTVLISAFHSTLQGPISGFAVSIVFALIGVPLLIPFFHLKHLRDLRLTDETIP